MKKLLPLIIAVLFSAGIKAQYVTIPDTNFVRVLKRTYPLCMMGNQMDTSCAAIRSAKIFSSVAENITDVTGIVYFDSLTNFSCFSNKLTTLPALPASLQELNCNSNQLTSLPSLPLGLIFLQCEKNQLTSLPTLPATLRNLSCYWNNLATLPTLPNGLLTINFGANSTIESPTVLPASLQRLTCENCNLTTLPPLHEGMLSADFGNNKISTVGATLPSTLLEFYCFNNLFTSLPPLPAGLEELECSTNQLSQLPALPVTLTKLSCSYNQLTYLPALPKGLTELNCRFNKLTSLPALPNVLTVCRLNDNPDLDCLPPLQKFDGAESGFSIANTSIKCLPNKIKHDFYPFLVGIDTMPICSRFNQYGCAVGWNIQGSVYIDANADCIQQGSEKMAVTPVKVNLYQAGNLVQSVYTFNGDYNFDTDISTYKIEVDTTGLPFSVSCINGLTLNITAQDSIQYNNNFGLRCKNVNDVGVISVYGNIFRPANNTTVAIAAGDMAGLYGLSCNAAAGTVAVKITGPAKYVSQAPGALVPDNVTGNTLTWNVANFASINTASAFNTIVRVDTTAQSGEQVCFEVTVTPAIADNNAANNILTQCFMVRTSFDPNDKQAYPSGNTDTSTQWLTYTVRFQNTGNDTAIHIYIMDTLDTKVQAPSFQLMGYSHLPMVQFFDPGIVRFNFPNIMLPDSNVNEKASHGYIQYRVKPKANLPIGTDITNTAYIYFDFNAPVVTNTTTNTMTVAVPTEVEKQETGKSVNLFPNPANNVLYTTTTGFTPQWITVYDLNGKKISEQQYTQQLDIANLQAGMYLLEVRSGGAIARNRFVKM